MAENIVAGLFGVPQEQVALQQRVSDEAKASSFAQMDPFERQNYQNYLWGAQIGRGLGGMMGLQDPQQQVAEQQKQIQSQIDHSTSEGLMRGAQLFNQAGNPRMAMMYQQAAAAKEKESADLARIRAQENLYQAQAQKAGREEDMSKYGRLQKVEIGVEGKPDYRQQALYDPLNGTVTKIGAPYRIPAAISAEGRVSATEAKTAAGEKKTSKGQETVTSLVSTLKDNYDNLNKLGGIVSTERGALENIRAQTMTTGAGQLVGGAVGTQSQKVRNEIKQTRPLLLNAIKEATGMTAKQMDSNVELQMYLSAATDPALGYEANMSALANLDKLYGLGVVADQVKSPTKTNQNDLAAAAKAELERRRKGK